MVFYHPMLVPRGYSSPFFDGKEITAFLKTLNRCFKDYKINNDTEKKERAAKYSARQYRKNIKRLPEHQDPSVSWDAFQKILLREYRYSDLD
jgi:hypothetical protein